MTHIKSEFSRILIAVDGSQSSMNAADRAIALAKKEKDRDSVQLLIALYVVFSRLGYAYSPAGAFGGMDGLAIPNPVKQILKGAKKEAQQWFDIIQKEINNNRDRDNNDDNNNIQLQTEVVVTATSIVSAIVEYAKRKHVDLIVIGKKRETRSRLKKML
ncbi:MAG: universal stress protein, partial [Nitrososphaeraceae archaeon]|nr:universal stress protein [Nitrososphaeraceae archaeon]